MNVTGTRTLPRHTSLLGVGERKLYDHGAMFWKTTIETGLMDVFVKISSSTQSCPVPVTREKELHRILRSDLEFV